jgi:hypothetical protein
MWPIRCCDRGREKRPLATREIGSGAAFSFAAGVERSHVMKSEIRQWHKGCGGGKKGGGKKGGKR